MEYVVSTKETFDQFVTELRLFVKDCGYTNPEEMVRDCVIFGIYSPQF